MLASVVRSASYKIGIEVLRTDAVSDQYIFTVYNGLVSLGSYTGEFANALAFSSRAIDADFSGSPELVEHNKYKVNFRSTSGLKSTVMESELTLPEFVDRLSQGFFHKDAGGKSWVMPGAIISIEVK